MLVAGGISSGFDGEEEEFDFDEFVLLMASENNTSKKMGLGLDFKRKVEDNRKGGPWSPSGQLGEWPRGEG